MPGSFSMPMPLAVDYIEGSGNEIGSGSVAGVGNHVDTVGSF